MNDAITKHFHKKCVMNTKIAPNGRCGHLSDQGDTDFTTVRQGNMNKSHPQKKLKS